MTHADFELATSGFVPPAERTPVSLVLRPRRPSLGAFGHALEVGFEMVVLPPRRSLQSPRVPLLGRRLRFRGSRDRE